MPYPWVTDVTVKSNQILLTVNIDGFTTGERIELSGYATQNNGAFAIFNDLQTVPQPTPDNKITMYVTSLSSAGFVKGSPVTVVMRAARVWAIVLGEPQTGPGRVQTSPRVQPQLAGEGTSWNVPTTPVAYPAPPSGGNADQTSTGSEASFPAN